MIYSHDFMKAFMAKPQASSQPKADIFHMISAYQDVTGSVMVWKVREWVVLTACCFFLLSQKSHSLKPER